MIKLRLKDFFLNEAFSGPELDQALSQYKDVEAALPPEAQQYVQGLKAALAQSSTLSAQDVAAAIAPAPTADAAAGGIPNFDYTDPGYASSQGSGRNPPASVLGASGPEMAGYADVADVGSPYVDTQLSPEPQYDNEPTQSGFGGQYGGDPTQTMISPLASPGAPLPNVPQQDPAQQDALAQFRASQQPGDQAYTDPEAMKNFYRASPPSNSSQGYTPETPSEPDEPTRTQTQQWSPPAEDYGDTQFAKNPYEISPQQSPQQYSQASSISPEYGEWDASPNYQSWDDSGTPEMYPGPPPPGPEGSTPAGRETDAKQRAYDQSIMQQYSPKTTHNVPSSQRSEVPPVDGVEAADQYLRGQGRNLEQEPQGFMPKLKNVFRR